MKVIFINISNRLCKLNKQQIKSITDKQIQTDQNLHQFDHTSIPALEEQLFDQILQKDKNSLTNFDSTDFFIINSNQELYPWMDKNKFIVQLVKQILKSNKQCLFIGPISLCVPYVLSSNGTKIKVFNNKGYGGLLKDLYQFIDAKGILPWHAFWENERGYIYLYDSEKKKWISMANVGFNKKYDGKSKYIVNNQQFNKTNVMALNYKNTHQQVIKNMNKEQSELKQESKFKLNDFKISDKFDLAIDKLGEHTEGVSLFAQGNVVCSMFTFEQDEYHPLLISNFVNNSYQRITNGEIISLSLSEINANNLSIYSKMHFCKPEALENPYLIQTLFEGCHILHKTIIDVCKYNPKSPNHFMNSGIPSSPSKLLQFERKNEGSSDSIVKIKHMSKTSLAHSSEKARRFKFTDEDQAGHFQTNVPENHQSKPKLTIKYDNQHNNQQHFETFCNIKDGKSPDNKNILKAIKNFNSHYHKPRPNTKDSRVRLSSTNLNQVELNNEYVQYTKDGTESIKSKQKSFIALKEFKTNLITAITSDDDDNVKQIEKSYNSSTGIRRKFQNNKKRLLESITQSKFNPWAGQGPTIQGNGQQVENPQFVERRKPVDKKEFMRFFGKRTEDQYYIKNYVGATPNKSPLTFKFRGD